MVARIVPVLMQLPVLVPGMSSPCSDGLGVTTGIGQAAVHVTRRTISARLPCYCTVKVNTIGAEHKLEWFMCSTLMEMINYARFLA